MRLEPWLLLGFRGVGVTGSGTHKGSQVWVGEDVAVVGDCKRIAVDAQLQGYTHAHTHIRKAHTYTYTYQTRTHTHTHTQTHTERRVGICFCLMPVVPVTSSPILSCPQPD